MYHYMYGAMTAERGSLWIKLKRADAQRFLQQSNSISPQVALLGQHLFEYYRIHAGIPQVGIEASEKEIILETGFDRAVARNKGCYPGQEVVERIFTYGSVNRKLMCVSIDCAGGSMADPIASLPLPLLVDDKPVGNLVSVESCPDDAHRAIGLAYVHRNYWGRRESFTCAPSLPSSLNVRLCTPE